MKPLISNIQRFSVHDGPGIRTTVFFKGCSLHCPWCANPENISFENEFYKSGEEIIPWGEHINEDSLYEKVTLDRAFYGKEGGVTFSGGEPLLFLPHYENFLKRAKQERLSIGVETALFVSLDNLICLNQYVDFYYIDLKILIEDECMNILGGKLETFFRNLEWLYQNVSKERIIYRIPLVPSITDTDNNIEQICKILEKYPPNHVEIFSVHNLGKRKYELLGRDEPKFEKILKDDLICIKKKLEDTKIKVCINDI